MDKTLYSGADSAYSDTESVRCNLARPDVSVKRSSNGKPVISWQAVEGAASYKVYYSTDGNNWRVLKTVSGTSLKHNSAKSGRTYYYKVVAVCTYSEANSADSGIKKIKSQ